MAPAPLRQRTALAETVTVTLAATARAAVASAVTATATLAFASPALAAPVLAALASPALASPALAAPAAASPALASPALASPALASLALASRAPAAVSPVVPPLTLTARAPLGAPATAAPAPNAPAPRIPAPDPPTPSCGTAPDGGFPLATRIHGGPADYAAGGSPQAWKLDLENVTDASCTGVHPVLVLTDRDRALRPDQIRFEFYDEGSARWRPVAFEETEEAENVGAFTGFGGFAVPAGRSLTVPVRLAFREDAAPDEVVVSAAVVQRRGADGDWIGASGDYRLTVGPVAPTASGTPEPTVGATDPPPAPTGPAAKPPKVPKDPKEPKEPKDPKSGTTTGTTPELAHTGRESDRDALLLAPFAAALVLLGTALVRTARRTARRTASPHSDRPRHSRHPRHP
ncbi:hypothetical protein [Streptomyces sp. NPDC056169]|uniref:hypothetical protein n=1 Tax=Streptomyces sp. NPDC056169 TaxID=3345734 RepID=UPI0035D97378